MIRSGRRIHYRLRRALVTLQRKPQKSHSQFSPIYSITGLRKSHIWNQRWNYCSSSTSNLTIFLLNTAYLLVISTNIVCIVPDVIVQSQDRIIFLKFLKLRQWQCCGTWEWHPIFVMFLIVPSSYQAKILRTIHILSLKVQWRT